ncbi:MAG TPA: formate dehydrogenase accessory protein FdhE, partial [Pyrinomonadaceae bacterium]|nr:formate dehydrogenase accessory protein FdhE [Pyrinomonadaceae bacterium]
MDFWERQIRRAEQLASAGNELLVFYTSLLRAQREIHDLLTTQQLSGELDRDLSALRPAFSIILQAVEDVGPQPLVAQAQTLKTQPIDEMLLSYWHAPSDTEFFAKAFLQPYGHFIAAGHQTINERRCPQCGGKPQLSFLQNKEAAESGNRDLICAKCLWTWAFRRVVCANCGEEDPAKLAYFQSKTIDHVRVEACDTCKHYLKGVDLTRLGIAQPLVDEVAAAPLDLWATEHG